MDLVLIMQWIKKLIVLMLFPVSGFSETIIESPVFLPKLYAGVSAGGMINQYKVNTTTVTQFPSSAFFTQSNSNANTFGANAQGSIFLGYLYALRTKFFSLYVGPEIYGSISNPTFSAYQAASSTLPTESLNTLSTGHLSSVEGDVDLRVGNLITPGTLLFGRIGAAFNTITINSVSTISRPALPLSSTVNNTYSNSSTGLRVGGGIEQKILPKFNIRVDYIFTHYPSVNFGATQQASLSENFQLAPITNNTWTQINTNAILFSVIYQDLNFA